MPKNKIGLKFEGLEEMVARIESAEGDIRPTVEAALKASKQALNPGINSAIAVHKKTGKTQASLDKNMKVKWEGTQASIEIGFHVRNGGLPSIFLMYGTPRVKKDTKLYNSIYGTKAKKEAARAQKEVFQKRIVRKLGG